MRQRFLSNFEAIGDGFSGDLVSDTEIRFAIGDDLKPVVMESIGDTAREPATHEAIYFDTDNLDLRRHRVELCVLKRNGNLVQKIRARAKGGSVLSRQSHETVLSDLQPNLYHARAVLSQTLRDVVSQAALKPHFRTTFNRIWHRFANEACTMRTSFDQGYVEAAGRSERISEVEFEVTGGGLACFTNECLSFLSRAPATLLMESKAARGYRVASGELATAINAHHFSISGDLSLPEAIIRIFRHSFQHFLDNHPAVTLSGLPESIHQMRVALRRLRSAIRMFSPVLRVEGANGVLEAQKALFSKLGEVREADVFIGETLPLLTRTGLTARLEAVLLDEIAAYRDRVYRDVRGELISPALARLVVQFNDWIEGEDWLKADRPIDGLLIDRSIEDFAAPRIRTLYSKLVKRGSKARHGTDDWHRARIAAKRVRYASEPLLGALGLDIDTRGFSKRLSRLQTSLGRLNDLQTITRLLSRVRPHVQGRNRRNFEAAEQFCRGWSGAAAAPLIKHAEDTMEAFAKFGLDTSV